jgi:hypothetical protein
MEITMPKKSASPKSKPRFKAEHPALASAKRAIRRNLDTLLEI